jgi:hypothetical protein
VTARRVDKALFKEVLAEFRRHEKELALARQRLTTTGERLHQICVALEQNRVTRGEHFRVPVIGVGRWTVSWTLPRIVKRPPKLRTKRRPEKKTFEPTPSAGARECAGDE